MKTTQSTTNGEHHFSNVAFQSNPVTTQRLLFEKGFRRSLVPLSTGQMEFTIFAPPDPENEPSDLVGLIHRKNNYTTFLNFIGNPIITPADTLDDAALNEQLHDLQQAMLKNNLAVISFSGIDNRTLYRFLTEEFLKMELTGFLYQHPTRYIYEEFHFDQEYEFKKQASNFLNTFFGRSLYQGAYKQWEKQLSNYDNLKWFRNSVHEFDEVFIEFLSLEYESECYTLRFHIKFIAILEDQVLIHRFEGDGECNFIKESLRWELARVEFPGV